LRAGCSNRVEESTCQHEITYKESNLWEDRAVEHFCGKGCAVSARIYICLLVVVMGGCAEDVANRYYGSAHCPPKKASEVELLSAAPSKAYEVIADIQSRNESPESLREKVAKIGADGIIVTTLGGRYDPTEEWAEQKSSREMYTRIVGSAIKYK